MNTADAATLTYVIAVLKTPIDTHQRPLVLAGPNPPPSMKRRRHAPIACMNCGGLLIASALLLSVFMFFSLRASLEHGSLRVTY